MYHDYESSALTSLATPEWEGRDSNPQNQQFLKLPALPIGVPTHTQGNTVWSVRPER